MVRDFVRFLLLWLLLSAFFAASRFGDAAFAEGALAGTGTVVISEVLWMGSGLSTADEWMELVAIGDQASDITGWRLTSVNSSGEEVSLVTFATGSIIAPGDVRIVSNYPVVSSLLEVEPWMTTTAMTLPNTKLLLRLRDGGGGIRDEVDDGVGVPFAGANPSGTGAKASMERIDLLAPGNLKENWQTAADSCGFKPGNAIFGTPGYVTCPFSSLSSSSSDASSSSSQSSTGSGSSSSSSGTGATETGATLAPLRVFVTEVLANPVGSDSGEWLEIGNLGTGSVRIAGWKIGAGSSPHLFVIPENRTESGAYPPGTGTGFTIVPGEHVSFRKSVSGVPLVNGGDSIRLLSGTTVIDELAYPETAEGVSYGRDRPFCIPTEGAPNAVLTSTVRIAVQDIADASFSSGAIVGQGRVTVNLLAEAASGSLAGARCRFDFGDGYGSDSCNPPAHSMDAAGTFAVRLAVENFCGESLSQSITVLILPSPSRGGSGGGQGSSAPETFQCMPKYFESGAKISEIFPDPFGNEEEGEWIEIENTTDEHISLCGWSIDDGEKGSDAFSLDHERLYPREFLLLPRTQTKIVLNNDGDSVRLFGPGGYLQEEMKYDGAKEGETFALRRDGEWVWTPFSTPGAENRFRTAERKFISGQVIVSAAFPNPTGQDEGHEWIEVMNLGKDETVLAGWSIDGGENRGRAFLLTGSLLPMRAARFQGERTGIVLANATGFARLLDPDGYVASVVGWNNAKEGTIYRPPHLARRTIPARVLRVISGDTLDVTLEDIRDLTRIPPPVKRRWVGLNDAEQNFLRVRLLGIDAPEPDATSPRIRHFAEESTEFLRALTEGKTVDLGFEGDYFDRSGLLLAYAFLDGHFLEEELLRRGLVKVEDQFPKAYTNEFLAFESEAKVAEIGAWSDREAALAMIGSGAKMPALPENLVQTGSVRIAAASGYSGTGILVSEIYPSPPATGSGGILNEEWIELFNATDHSVSLAGWTLDDAQDGGSKTWTFPPDSEIAANGYLLLSSLQTGLKWNNDGDDAWVISPDGRVSEHREYPSLSSGKSFAYLVGGKGIGGCPADPTPEGENRCRGSSSSSAASHRTVFSRGTSIPTRYVAKVSATESGSGRQMDGFGTGFNLVGREISAVEENRVPWSLVEWGTLGTLVLLAFGILARAARRAGLFSSGSRDRM